LLTWHGLQHGFAAGSIAVAQFTEKHGMFNTQKNSLTPWV
jgi:hypothetical protein